MCNLYYLLRTCLNLFTTLLFKLTNFTLFAIQNLSFYSSHSGSLPAAAWISWFFLFLFFFQREREGSLGSYDLFQYRIL